MIINTVTITIKTVTVILHMIDFKTLILDAIETVRTTTTSIATMLNTPKATSTTKVKTVTVNTTLILLTVKEEEKYD